MMRKLKKFTKKMVKKLRQKSERGRRVRTVKRVKSWKFLQKSHQKMRTLWMNQCLRKCGENLQLEKHLTGKLSTVFSSKFRILIKKSILCNCPVILHTFYSN